MTPPNEFIEYLLKEFDEGWKNTQGITILDAPLKDWLRATFKQIYSNTFKEAYSKGRQDGEKEMLDKVLTVLPPERIIHEYMPSQNTPENNAWNEYRNKTMEAIKSLTTKHD